MSTRSAPVRSDRRKPAARSLRVVRRKRRGLIKRGESRRFAPMAILSGLLVAAVVFGVLLEQVVLAQSAFELQRLRERVAAAGAEHEELVLEAATLDSEDRIERFARAQLGMVDPADVRYIVADVREPASGLFARRSGAGRPVSVPATASGVTGP